VQGASHERLRVRVLVPALLLASFGALAAPPAGKEPSPDTAAAAAEREAAYTRTIEKRSQDIVATLDLDDPAKATRVRDTLVAQYRALRDWHDANDAEIKALAAKKPEGQQRVEEIKGSLRKLHGSFIAALERELTDEQVEKVKDGMTYNVVRVTYDGYLQMLPTLTDAQKAEILETLKAAREEAMDGGSSEEKHAIFGRYKGRINNRLAAQGYDLKKASKEWQERLKKEKAGKRAEKPASGTSD
jgi:hypothetical protein